MSDTVFYNELLQAKVSSVQKSKFQYIAKKSGVKNSELFRQYLNDIIKDYEKKHEPIIVNQTFID